MNETIRKTRIAWLSLRIKHHRIVMDGESSITKRWKHHARCLTVLCRRRAELLTAAERQVIEAMEGLV